MIRPAVLLVVLVSLMASVRSFAPTSDTGLASGGVALGVGFLLLAALQAGAIFSTLGLPRLTGYLLTGLLCGPDVAGLLTPRTLDALGLVNGVAVGLIALSAGSEMNLRRLRPRLRSLLWMGALSLGVAMVSITGLAYLLAPKLPFLASMNPTQRFAAALSLGVVLTSLSPSVAIAMLSETGSEGPVSDTVLGLVVLADLLIVVLFAVVHALAADVFGMARAPDGIGPVPALALELFGSIAVGALVGTAMAVYARRVKSLLVLFALAVCVVSAEVGSHMHLDVLLICLTAGVMLENVFNLRGEALAEELRPAALPIFALFFALAGARLHFADLRLLWPFALGFASLRAGALTSGVYLGARMAGAERGVQRYAPFGAIPQAGVSVGLAVLLARHFPTWGPSARGLVLAVVTINELVGPLLLRSALVRSGESGRRAASGGGHH